MTVMEMFKRGGQKFGLSVGWPFWVAGAVTLWRAWRRCPAPSTRAATRHSCSPAATDESRRVPQHSLTPLILVASRWRTNLWMARNGLPLFSPRDRQVARLLLEQGVPASTPNRCGRAPLHDAAERGHVEVRGGALP
jgi:hypothetical protein